MPVIYCGGLRWDSEGVFYVVGCHVFAKVVDDENRSVPSHEDFWGEIKGRSDYAADFFPRGRVVIDEGHVVVYASDEVVDALLCGASIRRKIEKAFELYGVRYVVRSDTTYQPRRS
jgi:hypothetical protein